MKIKTIVILAVLSFSLLAIQSIGAEQTHGKNQIDPNATTSSDLSVSPNIWSSTIKVGEYDAEVFNFTNNGDTAISITSLNTDVEWISYLETTYPINLSPMESYIFPAIISPPEDLDPDNEYTGRVEIITDVAIKSVPVSLQYDLWNPELDVDEPIVIEYPAVNTTQRHSFSLGSNTTSTINSVSFTTNEIKLGSFDENVDISNPGMINFAINASMKSPHYQLSKMVIDSTEGTRTIPILYQPFLDNSGISGNDITKYTNTLPMQINADLDQQANYFLYFPVPSGITQISVNMGYDEDDPGAVAIGNITSPGGSLTVMTTDNDLDYSARVNSPSIGFWKMSLYSKNTTLILQSNPISINVTTSSVERLSNLPSYYTDIIKPGESDIFKFGIPENLIHFAVDIKYGNEINAVIFDPLGTAYAFDELSTGLRMFDQMDPESGIWTLTITGESSLALSTEITYSVSIYTHKSISLQQIPSRVLGEIRGGDSISYNFFIPDGYEQFLIEYDISADIDTFEVRDPQGTAVEPDEDNEFLFNVTQPQQGIWTLHIRTELALTPGLYDFHIFYQSSNLNGLTLEASEFFTQIDRGNEIEESIRIENNLDEEITINYLSSDNNWLDFGVPINKSFGKEGFSLIPYLVTPNSDSAGFYDGFLQVNTNFGQIYWHFSTQVIDAHPALSTNKLNFIVDADLTFEIKLNNIGTKKLVYFGTTSSQNWFTSITTSKTELVSGSSAVLSLDLNVSQLDLGINTGVLLIRTNYGPLLLPMNIIRDQISHNITTETFEIDPPSISSINYTPEHAEFGDTIDITAAVTDSNLHSSWVVSDDGHNWDLNTLGSPTQIGPFIDHDEIRFYILAVDNFGTVNVGMPDKNVIYVGEYVVRGQVTSSSDPVEGVFVTVEDEDTGFITHTTTDDSGHYQVILEDYEAGDDISINTIYNGRLGSGSSSVDLSSGVSNVDVTIVLDQTDPTVSDVEDFDMEAGDEEEITWSASDANPSHYSVYLNDELFEFGLWTGESISVDLSEFSLGEYDFEVFVYDIAGNSANDLVTVTISNDTDTGTGPGGDTTPTDEGRGNFNLVGLTLFVTIFVALNKRKRR